MEPRILLPTLYEPEAAAYGVGERARERNEWQVQLSAAAQLRHTPNNINVILQFLTLNCKSEGEEGEWNG